MKRISRLTAMILSLLLLAACGATPQEAEAPPAAATPASQPAPAPVVEPPPTTEPSPTEDPVYIPLYQFLLDNAIEQDNFDDTVTYSDLYDLADSSASENVCFTGKILEVITGDGYTGYRFAIDNDYDQIIYVETYPEYPTDTLAEDDYATVYGVNYGTITYETILGKMLTIPAVFAARFELNELPLPEFPTGPATIKTHFNGTIEIESFDIVDTDIAYNGDLLLTCQITGTVSGSDYLSFDLKCYDKDDIFIGTAHILTSVSDGEKFRISDDAFAPIDTVRVEFSTD